MKQKIEIASLIGLLVITVLVWYVYHAKPLDSAAAFSFTENYTPMQVQDLGPHSKSLETTRKTEYTKTMRNIFSTVAQAQAPDTAKEVAAPRRPVLPMEPPLPPPAQLPPSMKFFGYGTVPVSGTRRAFLSDGDDVYIVGEGETFLGHIRILRVGNDRLEIEDTNTGQRGFAMLEQPGPSA
jgi:hypothetical protein